MTPTTTTWIQTSIHHFQSDNEFIGDTLKNKTPSTFRIFYSNINGISAKNNFESLHMVLDSMNNLETDITCLAEHNLSTDQHNVRYKLHSIIKRHSPASRIITSTSPIEFPTSFKPGGCMNIITKSLHGRITQQKTDKLGRWNYVSLIPEDPT